MTVGKDDMTAPDAVRELHPRSGPYPIGEKIVDALTELFSVANVMNEKPDSVEIGQNAKRETYIKSVKIYSATDATPEEIADRVEAIFDAVNARLHPEDAEALRAARVLRGDAAARRRLGQ